MKKLMSNQAHKILSLIVAVAIIMSGVPLTKVSAADTATAGVTATDAAAIGLSGETEPDDTEHADTGEEEQQEESEEEPDPEPVDEDGNVATSGVTDGGNDASCVCTAFQSDPDCPVCKDDATGCAFYYCVCEDLCGEDSVNHDCPICRDDFTKCEQAVTPPENTTLAAGGIISADTSWAAEMLSGNLTVNPGVTLTLNGKLTISGNVTISGSGTIKRGADYKDDLISVPSDANLTLNSITIDGGNQDGVTGVLGCLVSVSGELNMNTGAVLQNNTRSNGGYGSGVNVGGTFNMSGGEISGNMGSDSGGGVSNSGTFNMSGGKISGNTTILGGGVFVGSGTFTMNGGTISGNTAASSGGGVFLSNGTFNISGSPKIENNIKGSGGENTGGVHLSNGKTITISSPLTAGARIGIEGMATTAAGTTVATNAAAGDLQCFYISNATGLIGTNNALVFDSGAIKLGTVQQVYVSNTGYDNIGLNPGDNGYANGTKDYPFKTIGFAYDQFSSGDTGEILVMDDITVDTVISLDGTKTVTLKSYNGTHTLTRGESGNLITVGSGASLTLENIIIDGDKNGGFADNSGSLVYVVGGTFIMNDGAVLQNNIYSDDSSGGGVLIHDGVFTMTGGTISGNAAKYGGGVGMNNSSTFTMSGGTISDNTAGMNSGGVYNTEGSTFTMNGTALISNNMAKYGGGVGNGGTFTMSDGTIRGNTSTESYCGGGVESWGTFTMVGGMISGNTSSGDNSGGVVHSGGTFTVGGTAVVSGNTKSGDSTPNNVFLSNDCYITLGTGSNGAPAPASGMEIGVTKTDNDGVFVNGGADADYVQYFKADDTTKEVVLVGNTLKLVTAALPITAAAISVTAPEVAAAPNTTASGTGDFTVGAVTWSPSDNPFKGGTQYTATVTLTANSGYTFTGGLSTATINDYNAAVTNNTGDTVTLSYQFPATGAATVTGITIMQEPEKLNYTHGEALDLSGLSIKVSYNDGTTATKNYTDFVALGGTISPANGAALSRTTHNGQPVTVSCNGQSAQTNNALTVGKATPSGTWPSGLTATYGQALSEIPLTSYTTLGGVAGTFTWTTTTDKVGNAGSQSHSMTFTPTDAANYNTATNSSVSVTVNQKAITVTATASNKTYDGNTAATVSLSSTGFESGDSPTINHTTATFSDKNTANGKTVNISGISLSGAGAGNYTVNATATATANITAKDIRIDTVAALTKTYDGGATATAGAVTFDVALANTELAAGTDYTVDAVFTGGNYNAGSSKPYTYTVTMKNTTEANNYNLTGGNTKTGSDGEISKAPTGLSATAPSAITILSTDTASHTFDLDDIVLNKSDCGTRSYALNGGLGGNTNVLSGGVSLGGTNNATLTYQGNGQTSGSATQSITITTANYENINVTITFTATAKNNVNNSITFTDGSATYDGTAKSHENATISGYSGGTWTYSYSGTANDSTSYGPTATAPTKAGTYTVTAKYEDASNLGTKTADFTINPRNISNAAIAAIADQTYTGGAITPTPNVSDSGATITASDYTVAYVNNTNVGTATVTLTGQNNYTGTKTANFNIVAIPLTNAAITVTAPAKGVAPNITANGTGNFTIGAVSWNPSHNPFQGGTQYTATVTLTANSGHTFAGLTAATINGNTATVTNNTGSAVTLSYQFPATPARAVDSISVTTQPKLIYVTSDKLDLTALRVEVTYDDTSTENIAYNKTGLTYKIDGDTVTSSETSMSYFKHDSKKIVVSYGGETADTNSLTVYETPVLQITVSDIDSTSAKIIYSATTDSRNTVTSKLQVKSGSAWSDVTGASSPYTASGLSANTSYEYRVWAKDNTTNREYAKPVSFRTSESAPTGITVDGDIINVTTPTDIWVTLEHGNTVIASVQATVSGSVATTYTFSFSNVPDGIFNLVVDNGSWKVTQAVTIVGGVVTHPVGRITIDMSTGKTQSVVDIVTNDTPPAAVGGLPDLFSDSSIYTPDDEIIVAGGGTVEIKLAVEKKNEADVAGDAAEIKSASGQEIGLYLDLSVIKSQLDDTGALIGATPLTTLNGKLITITFELPDDLKGKSNLTIYRVHGGNAEALTSTPNASGESAVISGDIVTLKVCKFSTYAIAYTPSNPPVNPPNPPSSNGGSSSGGGGGSGGSGTAPAIVTTYWIEVPEAKTMAKTAKEQNLDYVRSRRATITGIRKDALLALTGLRYQHDTVADSAVQVRVYVDDPAKAVKDILVSGYVKGDTVNKVTARFEKWFQNKLAVVSLDQQGDFGMVVQIAAKVDLSGMDTNNLYFYGYDRKANKYSRIHTEYRIDTNGYLHFATGLAGDIIVSNGPLTKKSAEQIAADVDKYYYLAASNTLEITNDTGSGGDIMPSVVTPPQEAKQNPSTGGDSLSYMNAADTPLKLEKADNQSAGGVLVIDLDAPVIQDALSESLERDKVSVYVVIGITSVLLLAAMMLWAAIPRKDDPIVTVEEYRKKQ